MRTGLKIGRLNHYAGAMDLGSTSVGKADLNIGMDKFVSRSERRAAAAAAADRGSPPPPPPAGGNDLMARCGNPTYTDA